MARQRPVRLISVFALVVGFALLLPAHHHGWLTVDEPGQSASAVASSSLASERAPLASQHSHPDAPGRPSHHDSSHCAICLVGRTLDLPHPASLGALRLELTAVRPIALPSQRIAAREFFPALYGRAPPVAA